MRIILSIVSIAIPVIVLLGITQPAYGLIDPEMDYYLKLLEREPTEERPFQKIIIKNDVLYCTGESEAATANNKAADFMEHGDYAAAIEVLENGLKHAPLFFPFRYNLGICYIYENKLKISMLHFEKARAVVPEFPKLYLHTGYIYRRWNKIDQAISEFKKAIRCNRKELNAYVNIGDLFFERKQNVSAKKFYDAALEIDHKFPNGLLGNAKIYFVKEEYIKAIVLFKSIDTTKDYDKSLHYYYAESSYKLNDYEKAAAEYELLLTFRYDKFFLTHSRKLIEYKLELAKRFLDR